MAFKKKRFTPDSLDIVRASVEIIDRYEGMGYKLSLRQLYYQLVSQNIVPNTERSYHQVGVIISDARMAGYIDWDMIEDRGRECVTVSHWNKPSEIIETAASSYRIDKWEQQPVYCEVMVEKQALEGILEPVCRELDIPFTANKGYSSQTMMFYAGRRLRQKYLQRAKDLVPAPFRDQERGIDLANYMIEEGFITAYEDKGCQLTKLGREEGWPVLRVFYLGDHDPSGMDMTRDVANRLKVFSDYTPMEVVRLALNMDQIEELNPPENPAKVTDSRARDYIARFGESSWELDAVAPDALAEIVRNAVTEFRDRTAWTAAVERENSEREKLREIADNL